MSEINVNYRPKGAFPALLYAAGRNGRCDTDCVIFLLTFPDIQVNLQDNAGDTALMWAARQGGKIVMKCLLMRPEIDVYVRNHRGESLADAPKACILFPFVSFIISIFDVLLLVLTLTQSFPLVCERARNRLIIFCYPFFFFFF